jgi:hypothetical protein
MKTTTLRRQLLALHRSQQRLFAGSVKSLQRQFEKLPEAEHFLAQVSKLATLVQGQTSGFEGMIAVAAEANLPEGNNSKALMDKMRAGEAYNFLSNKRFLVEHIGDLDEWRMALASISDIMEAAKPFKDTDAKVWSKACAMSWSVAAAQDEIHALARYTDSITATQEALLRTYGMKFWQGRGRIMRCEGDRASGTES